MHPQKRNRRRRRDARAVNVPRRASDDAPDGKADDDGDVFEEWGAEEFGEDDGDEGEEAETDEFGGAPAVRVEV